MSQVRDLPLSQATALLMLLIVSGPSHAHLVQGLDISRSVRFD